MSGKLLYYLTLCLFVVASCCAKASPIQEEASHSETLSLAYLSYHACGGELGPIAMTDVVGTAARVAEGYFSSLEDRKAFLLLICIESKWNPGAISRVGAVGLTQIMPKYARSFAAPCYLSTEPQDLFVPSVNLQTAACQFRHLLTKYKSRYSLALAAYNAGEDSPTVRRLMKHQRINQETSEYISHFWALWEELEHAEHTSTENPSVGLGSSPVRSTTVVGSN